MRTSRASSSTAAEMSVAAPRCHRPADARRRKVGVEHLTELWIDARPQPQAIRDGAAAASVMGRAYRRCKVPLVPAPLNLVAMSSSCCER